MEKKQLRADLRKLNKEKLTPPYRATASLAIARRIESLEAFQRATRVGLFHALPDEPDLHYLLDKYGHSKELYLPRVEGDDVAFYRYNGESTLAAGSFGIAEPQDAPSEAIAPDQLELIVVPGVAFTREGVRLGRGKGYYDRFLPQTGAMLVGCVFHYRLLENIPSDPWDHPMDAILTDEISITK